MKLRNVACGSQSKLTQANEPLRRAGERPRRAFGRDLHFHARSASGSRVAPGHYDNAAILLSVVRHRDQMTALPIAAPPDPAPARASDPFTRSQCDWVAWRNP